MKKIIRLVALVAALWVSLPAVSQVKFGVKGGLNATSFSLSKDLYSTENRMGFYVGPTVKVALPLGFGVDAAALYDQRSMKGDEGDAVKQQQLAVPVNLRYGIGLGSLFSVFMFAGPQVGFNLNKNEAGEHTEVKFKNSDLSVNVGLGLMMFKHLQLSANYNIACGKTCDVTSLQNVADVVKTKGRYNAWQVGLAYYF